MSHTWARLTTSDIPLTEAESLAEARDAYYIVETVNWTYATKPKKRGREEVHLNRYFALDLSSAIGVAAQIEIAAQEVSERVVAIRLATPEEAEEASMAYDHFMHGEQPTVAQLGRPPKKKGARR